ncbi:MAG: MBL fold metallo-hydrolase, partial [Acidobacteriota bacterium]
LNVLTDPVWSRRTSPFTWVGPARFHAPGVAMSDLPHIDVVLISHNHFDHMDVATLQKLAYRDSPRIFAGLGNREFLERNGVTGAVDLDWWSSSDLAPGVTLTAVPVRHWSTRTRLDLRKTLWVGFVLTTSSGRIYFPGDTGFGDHFQLVRNRMGAFRLALLPIGSFLPRWFMQDNHLSPEEAASAHRILGAQTSVAIHFGTFNLGDDSQFEARDRMQRLIDSDVDLRSSFRILEPGAGVDVPPFDGDIE